MPLFNQSWLKSNSEFMDQDINVPQARAETGFMAFCYIILLLNCNFFLQEVLEGREGPALPAARVVPTNGELFWLVDDPAAASLTIQVERLGSGDKL